MLKKMTVEEKVAIIKEGEANGVLPTCRKHGIHHSTYYRWLDGYTRNGIEGLRSVASVRSDPEKNRLNKENAQLKKILAEKELALAIKEDLLKKTIQRQQTKG